MGRPCPLATHKRHPAARCAGDRYAAAGPACGPRRARAAEGSTSNQERTPDGEKYMTASEEVGTREQPGKPSRKPSTRNKPERSRPRRPVKPPQRPRGSVVAALDIGTTKVCCFIARAQTERQQIVGI